MSYDERLRPQSRTPAGCGDADPTSAGSGVDREQVQRLAEAADRAIERALSQDSARFLAQNRQESGE